MGRDGARPSRVNKWSEGTIGALIKTWRAPGPSAPAERRELRFAATRHAPNVGLYGVPRLRGTAALQSQCSFQGGMTSVPSHFSPCYKG